jgi:hypothetical protein
VLVLYPAFCRVRAPLTCRTLRSNTLTMFSAAPLMTSHPTACLLCVHWVGRHWSNHDLCRSIDDVTRPCRSIASPSPPPLDLWLPQPTPTRSVIAALTATASSRRKLTLALGLMLMICGGTVRVCRQKFTLEDAIGSHACSLQANMRVTNGIPLGSSLLLPVCTVNCVRTLKAHRICCPSTAQR